MGGDAVTLYPWPFSWFLRFRPLAPLVIFWPSALKFGSWRMARLLNSIFNCR